MSMRRGYLMMLLLWQCTPEFGAFELHTDRVRGVIGRGEATYDADSRRVEWRVVSSDGTLLDSSDVLPNAGAHNCEAAGWNAATRVLSVNAYVANHSSATTYLSPVELRLTGIAEINVVASVNTDLSNAGCGANGLSLGGDDLDSNGVFDCISPDDGSNTADDPGWDFSSALGADNALGPGESSGCRFVHFNLVSETNFTFYFEILGVIDDGWPPAPSLDPGVSPTGATSQTLTGRCVTTLNSPDQLNPPPSEIPATNEITVLGGVSPVTVNCDDAASCQVVGPETYCGTYSVLVSLQTNQANALEIYQELDGIDRGASRYYTIVHDAVAPIVIATNPANGAIGVVPASNVRVTFSEAMNATTINSTDAQTANIYLREQGLTARIPAVVAQSGLDAILNPDADLLDEATYEVVVTTGVLDLVGLGVNPEYVSSFTTTTGASDTTPPTVSSLQPPHGAAGVDRRTAVVITFSEPIADGSTTDPNSPSCVDSGTVTCTAIAIDDVVRSQRVPGTRTLSIDGMQVTFTVNDPNYDSTAPDGGGICQSGQPPTVEYDFDCETAYELIVGTAITDLSGNPMAVAVISAFATGTDPDIIPPQVEGFMPAAGAVDVSESIYPKVLFSEPVASASVTTSSFFLKQDGTLTVPGSVSVAGDGMSATFTPFALLALSTHYVLFANNAITDLAGNPLQAPVNSDFTTRAAGDTDPPFVAFVTPPDGAPDVSRATDVVIEMNEPVDATTVSTASVLLDEMSLFDPQQVEASVPGLVTLAPDGLTITFEPLDVLTRWRVHRLTVLASVSDIAQNPMGADFVSTFQVEGTDSVAPCVVGLGPTDGSAVPQNTHFTVIFSEAMEPSSVVASAFVLEDDSGTPVATTVSLSADQAQVLVVPDTLLPVGTASLTVTNDLTDDSVQQNVLDQGSSASGCLNPTGPAEPVFGFTVDASIDDVPPSVSSFDPAGSAVDVPLVADVVVTFSEPIDPLTVDILITNPGGGQVPAVRSFSPDATAVILDPVGLLDSLTVYTVTVPANVRDVAGNAIGQTTVSQFTTLDGSIDTTSPSIVSTCPVDDDNNTDRWLELGCNPNNQRRVVIVFDEPLNSDTVHSGTFHLVEEVRVLWWTVKNDVTAAVELSADGMTVIITPQFSTGSGLKNATYHQIVIGPNVTDTFGNILIPMDLCALGTGESCVDFDT